MPALDFKEIHQANLGGGYQDSWEEFSEEFLRLVGFRIVRGPNRGADRGRDLIVEGVDPDSSESVSIRWLVSCKHKAHSGTSVTPNDEVNIRERMEIHDCTGFIGVYSTIPSTGLDDILHGLKNISICLYPRERIEARLLSDDTGQSIAKRYMPESYERWYQEQPRSAELVIRDLQRISRDGSEHYYVKTWAAENSYGISLHPKHADAALISPLSMSGTITFDDSDQGQQLYEEFRRFMEEDGEVWIPAENYTGFEFPEEVTKILGELNEGRGRIGLRSIPVYMSVMTFVETDDARITPIGPLRLKRTRLTDDLTEFSNQLESDGLIMTWQHSESNESSHLSFTFEHVNQSVERFQQVLQFRQALSKGGFLKVSLQQTGRIIFEQDIAPSSDIDVPPMLWQLVKALRAIERKTGQAIVLPDRPITTKDVDAAEEIASVVTSGVRNVEMLSFTVSLEEAKGFVSERSADSIYAVGFVTQFLPVIVVDNEVQLGPAIYKCDCAVVLPEDRQAILNSIEQNDAEVTIRFTAIHGSVVTEHYLQWNNDITIDIAAMELPDTFRSTIERIISSNSGNDDSL